jgi:hypothetical protein
MTVVTVGCFARNAATAWLPPSTSRRPTWASSFSDLRLQAVSQPSDLSRMHLLLEQDLAGQLLVITNQDLRLIEPLTDRQKKAPPRRRRPLLLARSGARPPPPLGHPCRPR